MTPRSVGAALLLVALLALAPASAGGQEEPETWYAQVLAHSAVGINVTHFWSRGAKLRAETVVAGHKVVTIVNGELYTAYDALANRGVSLERSPEALAGDASGRRPFGNEAQALIEQGAEKVREEPVLGRPCDVYRITDERGRRDIWVTRDEGRLPIRVEVYDRARKSRFSTEYLSWQQGLPVPESFFEPDPGVTLERYDVEEYYRRSAEQGPVGTVPILYSDLLLGRSP